MDLSSGADVETKTLGSQDIALLRAVEDAMFDFSIDPERPLAFLKSPVTEFVVAMVDDRGSRSLIPA